MYCGLLKKATNGLTGLCTAESCHNCRLFWGKTKALPKREPQKGNISLPHV